MHRQRGTGIWRRCLLIACEDVGIGDLDLVRHATLMTLGRDMRRPFGDDSEVLTDLVRRLAEAPKDRSPDYLICTAIQHPGFEHEREMVAQLSTDQQIAVAVDPDQPVVARAIAMWHASGVNGGGPKIVGTGALPQLLDAFDQRGFPDPLASIIETAARKCREPIVVMIPLLWKLVQERRGTTAVEDSPVPTAPTFHGVPAWTWDKHTRLGKRAMRQFLRETPTLDATMSRYVSDFRAPTVVEMACFLVDAIPIARRLNWSRSRELEAMGLETDMMKIGCPRDGVKPILDIVRANLDQLNSIRCRLLAAQIERGSVA
ncbi:hypothetical protein [Sphingopyxis sp. 2PD]|uniref:hypothetical protein n=1 Tax=Sphingopyxis sp. 2PD TaxID=2502196 RepID=UPI0010F8985F|nr:hypothetical protein [Sphingopyxis sp. 2PD]